MRSSTRYLLLAGSMALLASSGALAQESAMSGADTAWIITATALVLFMTMPGLALFYGGLVQSRNLISVLMHCFTICCLSSILWLVVGYSIAFGDGNLWWGGFGKSFMAGIDTGSLSGTLPESVFFMFQMAFAIITPALIVGAYVERIRFAAVVLFSGLWLLIVYAPSTHWIWGGGLLSDLGWIGLEGVATMDFAGGLVVHANAGVAALIIAMVLGKRQGFPNELRPPHSPGLTMIGAAMLWVGWYGFNAGSALAADGAAGMAMTVTHISASAACLTWVAIEWIKFGKPSLVGIATGAIAGLATITPASGFVGPVGGLVYGILAGLICFISIEVVKRTWQIDDSLDVFAVHGIGGILGILLTSVFASPSLGGLVEGHEMGIAFMGQLTATLVTVVWAGAASYVIVKVVQRTVGLRTDSEDEIAGLDTTAHGQQGYVL